MDDRITSFSMSDYECIVCGEMMDEPGKFCSEYCLHEYNYTNRTCETCGGEFWDGGTSCDCEDLEDADPGDWFPDDEDGEPGDGDEAEFDLNQ